MTETQWLTTTRPYLLLGAIAPSASERKRRLLAVACCLRVRDILGEPRWRHAVEKAELYADGLCAGLELDAVRRKAATVSPIGNEGAAVLMCASVVPFRVDEVCAHAGAAARQSTERAVQANLIRDIFGNPFRPVAFAPEWRTSTAVAIAQRVYESRDFSAMPILADALQDAGCDSDDILTHCRDTSLTHVRGCWATDLVLGKS